MSSIFFQSALNFTLLKFAITRSSIGLYFSVTYLIE